MSKHKVFISYHHANDQWAKEELLDLNREYDIFIDGSVDTGDIDDELTDESIRKKIRDDYLKDTTVTILLVGEETKKRKHIDWEIYSSMYNGKVNKQSGILVIQLPSINPQYIRAAHGNKEKDNVYPNINWTSFDSQTEYKSRYPYLPARIIDNLLKSEAKISVAKWGDLIAEPEKLRALIEYTFQDRQSCDYDLSQPMRRNNS